MRQLPKIARIQLERGDVREVASSDERRGGELPSIVVVANGQLGGYVWRELNVPW
jgi:hypothetical protein